MPEMEQAAKTFADGVARRIKLNFALEDELARVLEPEKTAQTSN